jgi:hypothetical protein
MIKRCLQKIFVVKHIAGNKTIFVVTYSWRCCVLDCFSHITDRPVNIDTTQKKERTTVLYIRSFFKQAKSV